MGEGKLADNSLIHFDWMVAAADAGDLPVTRGREMHAARLASITHK